MHYRRSSNINFRKLLPIGILCSIGLSVCIGASCEAASIDISMGEMNGRNILQPGTGKNKGEFYMPITIKINGAQDYTVSFKADNDGKLEDATTHEYISTVSSGSYSVDNITENKWGLRYKFGDTIMNDTTQNYGPAPTTMTPIIPSGSGAVTGESDGTEVTKVLTLGYATKIGEDFPAGNYKGSITVNVVATPLETLHSLVYMQDMTHEVCERTTTPTSAARSYDDTGSKQGQTGFIPRTMLLDSRDQHWYIIEKLADGNCWMTENLALSSGTTEATRRTITSADSNVTSDYKLPISSTSGFNSDSGQFMYNGTETSTVTSDISTHYNTTTHTGGYYSWPTATAGEGKNGAIAAGNNATQDICPKGWQLPTSMASGQFKALYDKYGNKTNFDQVWHIVNNNSYVGSYFTSALANSAARTGWWSRTSGSDTNAYYLEEHTSGRITPSYNDFRFIGLSIRCVAK